MKAPTPSALSLPVDPAQSSPGAFNPGQWVKLLRPEESRGSFADAEAALEIVGKYWFQTIEGPAYALAESGGFGCGPYRDADLRAALAHETPT